ncbi:uncharacterized protein Bfra_003346 [Botrytis fragariae]|uniref:Uncharacterized protein n=1 Tax=Botrytis fragariae TaxID=1964551 RepID=A0A8H6AWR0_9HELO|nr:uncharacterized protein Bfra_003346 [Botrytis fragariae]KAF5874895.1 hypothetical protein Bfra_003346 [Botrytis fragariae]
MAPHASKFTEHIDGPIGMPAPRSVNGPCAPVPHKITRKPVPRPIFPPPKKAPVKVGEGSCCGCVVM